MPHLGARGWKHNLGGPPKTVPIWGARGWKHDPGGPPSTAPIPEEKTHQVPLNLQPNHPEFCQPQGALSMALGSVKANTPTIHRTTFSCDHCDGPVVRPQ